jgi:glycosyltransferase involved in cell wall biosynthesis
VCDDLCNGGAQRQMTLLARSLPDDFRVRVFSLGGGPYAEVLSGAGVETRIERRRSRYDISPALCLRQEMIQWRPDVVHSWGWMSSAAALVMCRLFGVPLVDGTIRTGRPPERWTRLKRFLVSRADAIIANSEAGLTAHDVRRPGTFVVYNGFEAGRVPGEGHESARPAGRVADVVMAARMVPGKDFDTLIDVAELLQREGRAIRFTLMGGGPDGERLNARSRALQDVGLVRILDLGPSEVMPVLAAASIGVLLTDTRYVAEGLSNAIMEYMACGLPVVCTNEGGNREIVSDGCTGLLVPPRDVPAVVDALHLLLDEPDTAHRLGTAGRERIRAEFSVEAMVENTIAVYESVIRDDEARRPRRMRTPEHAGHEGGGELRS